MPELRSSKSKSRGPEGRGEPIWDQFKLVDPATGEDAAPGERGELWVRGPQVMKGYWPEPGSGLTEDGWLHTGDIGTMDEEGYFQVVDRTKDMVNISGLKVYTTYVDEVLYRHPVPIETPLRVVGRILRLRGRLGKAEGQIVLPDSTVACEAQMSLADVPKKLLASANPSLLNWKVD